MTNAGKMSVNAHGLILSYRQKKIRNDFSNSTKIIKKKITKKKFLVFFFFMILVEFEVFTRMSSLSLRLVIPMLQIAIKHLKVHCTIHYDTDTLYTDLQ